VLLSLLHLTLFIINRVDFDTVSMLILDEADRLLEMGFVEEVTEIIKAVPKSRQTMLFSATFGTKVDELIKLSLKLPVRVRVGRENTDAHVEVAPRLEQEFVRIRSGNEGNREAMLLSLLSRTFKDRVIVFFDTKLVAHRMMIVAGLCGLKVSEAWRGAKRRAVRTPRRGQPHGIFECSTSSSGVDISFGCSATSQ